MFDSEKKSDINHFWQGIYLYAYVPIIQTFDTSKYNLKSLRLGIYRFYCTFPGTHLPYYGLIDFLQYLRKYGSDEAVGRFYK